MSTVQKRRKIFKLQNDTQSTQNIQHNLPQPSSFQIPSNSYNAIHPNIPKLQQFFHHILKDTQTYFNNDIQMQATLKSITLLIQSTFPNVPSQTDKLNKEISTRYLSKVSASLKSLRKIGVSPFNYRQEEMGVRKTPLGINVEKIFVFGDSKGNSRPISRETAVTNRSYASFCKYKPKKHYHFPHPVLGKRSKIRSVGKSAALKKLKQKNGNNI